MNKKTNKRILGMTQTELLILVAMGGLLLCVLLLFGYIIYVNRSNLVAALPPISIQQPTPNPLNGGEGITAKVLSAQDVFEVSAVDVVESEGYTVTSAICEVVSPERYQPIINNIKIDAGQIVFHAFRITGLALETEVVVLFGSNHTAADGSGLVWTINAEAQKLIPEFPYGHELKYPITVDTAGAQTALACARQAGTPPPIKLENIDVEAWRRKVIEKFGPEQTLSDGSKDDYVRYAFGICKYKEFHPNMTYEEGSFQQYVLDTFCPYVWGSP